MTPEIGLLSMTQIDWATFRATVDKVLDLRPDIDINRLPVNLSNDAKILLNVAAYYGWKINNPLGVLRRLPPMFMEFLHYSFFIACDSGTWYEFLVSKEITVIKRELPEYLLVMASGSLANWYVTITNNLERDWEYTHDTRVLYNKLLLFFERRGLGFLFEEYKKKVLQDFTFLLEKK